MGIRSLSSFFDQNPGLSKPYKLHDTPVIIDGNNLVHLLYFNHKIDCVFGGDYHKYAKVIAKFMSVYLDCNIKPIVIFDGAYDKSDRKLGTVCERARKRLSTVQHIVKYGTCSDRVLPILSIEVMKDVLRDMGIMFAQCDFEADEEITCLANYYKCPILSQDSDFYIFDLDNGFIRFDSISSSPIIETDETGTEMKFLSCDIYFIQNFLDYFPGINRNVLPLFGILQGNDYVQSMTFAKFFNSIQLPKVKTKLKIKHRHKRMIGLLLLLKNYTLQDATRLILNHLKAKQREDMKELIEDAISRYNTDESGIVEHLTTSFDKLTLEKKVPNPSSFNDKVLPDWFVKDFRNGNISTFVLNVIFLRRIFLPSQVDDVTLNSSYFCSLELRQIIYGILLSFDTDSELDSHCSITEYDNRSGTLRKELIPPITKVPGFGTLPTFNEIPSLDSNTKRKIMISAIQDENDYILSLPSKLQLLIGTVRLWFRSTTEKPSIHFINAFLVSVIFLNVRKTSKEENGSSLLDDLECAVTTTSFFDSCEEFYNKAKKYSQKPQFNKASPLEIGIEHSFSELQTCVLYVSYLNQLLGSPFLHIKIQNFFSGTLLYNLTKDISSRPYPDLFLSELLGRETTLHKLFLELRDKVVAKFARDYFSTKSGIVKKKKKSRGKLKK